MERGNLFKKSSEFHKASVSLLFAGLLILVTVSQASAHRVILFAYVEGNKVFTESYFNDGKRCQASKIEVFDTVGNKLLEGVTDKAGEFSFKIPGKTDLRLILTATMGHRAEYTIPASELPGVIEERFEKPGPQPVQQGMPVDGIMKKKEIAIAEVTQADLEEIRSVIEDALDKKLRPLTKLIAKSQEHRVSATEVIGGIGYILGIMGIVMYFRSRKR